MGGQWRIVTVGGGGQGRIEMAKICKIVIIFKAQKKLLRHSKSNESSMHNCTLHNTHPRPKCLLQYGFLRPSSNWIRAWLKGTMSRDFRDFFIKILHLGPHINRQKRFREIFSFCKDNREKRVRVVIDYADTLATKSLTMPTRCQPGHLQYADTMSA